MRALWDMIGEVAPSCVSEFSRPAGRFSLESGKIELREKFPYVAVDRYEDELHVTEVEPVLDYIQSMSRGLTDQQITELARNVGEQIDRNGNFVIDKANGILIARK